MIIMQGDKKEAKSHSFEWLGQVGNLVSGLATAGALIFTAFSVQATQDQVAIARQQARTEQQGQVTDRFTKSVEQLGSDRLEVRVGGVYALERVMRDSPTDRSSVMDVLTAFIREHPPSNPSMPVEYSGLDADVQASITVIERKRDVKEEAAENYQLPLDQAPLAGAMLRNADLFEVDFRSADFEKADFEGANLGGADLRESNIGSAILRAARLDGADIENAYLEYSDFESADFRNANLTNVNLRNTDLRNADLRNANLRNAYLEGAKLGGAKLGGAKLDGANLEGATGLPPA